MADTFKLPATSAEEITISVSAGIAPYLEYAYQARKREGETKAQWTAREAAERALDYRCQVLRRTAAAEASDDEEIKQAEIETRQADHGAEDGQLTADYTAEKEDLIP